MHPGSIAGRYISYSKEKFEMYNIALALRPVVGFC
jgi:hypothetical protein